MTRPGCGSRLSVSSHHFFDDGHRLYDQARHRQIPPSGRTGSSRQRVNKEAGLGPEPTACKPAPDSAHERGHPLVEVRRANGVAPLCQAAREVNAVTLGLPGLCYPLQPRLPRRALEHPAAAARRARPLDGPARCQRANRHVRREGTVLLRQPLSIDCLSMAVVTCIRAHQQVCMFCRM